MPGFFNTIGPKRTIKLRGDRRCDQRQSVACDLPFLVCGENLCLRAIIARLGAKPFLRSDRLEPEP